MGFKGKGTPLSLEVMWQAKQMYEKVDERGRRLYSLREVAAHFGISETSVLRAVSNTGRFANLHNAPLPEVKSEQQMSEGAQASLDKLQRLLAAEKLERTPGSTKADKFLEELTVPQAVKDKARQFLVAEAPVLGNEPRVEGNEPEKADERRVVSPLDE